MNPLHAPDAYSRSPNRISFVLLSSKIYVSRFGLKERSRYKLRNRCNWWKEDLAEAQYNASIYNEMKGDEMHLQEVMNDEFNPIAMHARAVAFMRYQF